MDYKIIGVEIGLKEIMHTFAVGKMNNLENDVRENLKNGWKPAGGLCAFNGYLFQALYKE